MSSQSVLGTLPTRFNKEKEGVWQCTECQISSLPTMCLYTLYHGDSSFYSVPSTISHVTLYTTTPLTSVPFGEISPQKLISKLTFLPILVHRRSLCLKVCLLTSRFHDSTRVKLTQTTPVTSLHLTHIPLLLLLHTISWPPVQYVRNFRLPFWEDNETHSTLHWTPNTRLLTVPEYTKFTFDPPLIRHNISLSTSSLWLISLRHQVNCQTWPHLYPFRHYSTTYDLCKTPISVILKGYVTSLILIFLLCPTTILKNRIVLPSNPNGEWLTPLTILTSCLSRDLYTVNPMDNLVVHLYNLFVILL